MEKYDYLAAVIEDVKNVVLESYDWKNELKEDRYEFEQKLMDELWVNDSVTGNESGSYTFNAWQAEEYLCHNFDLLKEACDEFSTSLEDIIESAETCDVTIRCYLLGQAVSAVCDELESELDEDEE